MSAREAQSDPSVLTTKYKAFISYSHTDVRWAEWLHRRLETYRLPVSLPAAHEDDGGVPPKLGTIFRDRDELTSGDRLADAIQGAIAASEHLIVVCSPAAARSRYVNQEVIEFKRLDRMDRIHAFVVAGEPYASIHGSDADEECLPPALLFAVDSEGRLTSEPSPEILAVDVRPGKDAKTRSLVRLIAGLIDLDFDSLYQRERRDGFGGEWVSAAH